MNDPCLAPLLDLLNRPEPTLWLVDENLPREFVMGLRPGDGLQAITNRFDTWQALRNRQIACELNDFDFASVKAPVARVLYRVSKERALVHHCINGAAELLMPGGELLLLGRKNDGIKTHLRNGEQRLGSKGSSKKHGLCYLARVPKEEPGPLLPSDDYPHLRELELDGFRFFSKPGIFGWNKIDHGSELLLTALRQEANDCNTRGRVLDLGCGWGYLLMATADRPFAERLATDNNVTALLAAKRNFQEMGLEAETLADDCGSTLTAGFDVILCNPPFHQGFAVSESLSERFVSQAAGLLAKTGCAFFVVNQFVPLDRLAARHFANVRLLLQRDGFKVFGLGH